MRYPAEILARSTTPEEIYVWFLTLDVGTVGEITVRNGSVKKVIYLQRVEKPTWWKDKGDK
jgi:hypothetical protein